MGLPVDTFCLACRYCNMHVPSLGKTTNVSISEASIAPYISVKAIQQEKSCIFSSRSTYLCPSTKVYNVFNSRILSSSYGDPWRTMAIIFCNVLGIWSDSERYCVPFTEIIIIVKIITRKLWRKSYNKSIWNSEISHEILWDKFTVNLWMKTKAHFFAKICSLL